MTIDVILNIIYFLLSLTVLVSIHELGHLSMAKLFGVYCIYYMFVVLKARYDMIGEK